MKILMAGDCLGRPGRTVMTEKLKDIRREYELDLVIANVENASGGFSITKKAADELFAAGIEVMTSGNHIFDKKEVLDFIKNEPRLLRPINYVPTIPGSGIWTGEVNNFPVAVINVQGRVFMPPCDDPFRAIDAALIALDPKTKLFSWICMPKLRLKKWRWEDFLMVAFQLWSAHIRTFKQQMNKFCHRALPT